MKETWADSSYTATSHYSVITLQSKSQSPARGRVGEKGGQESQMSKCCYMYEDA